MAWFDQICLFFIGSSPAPVLVRRPFAADFLKWF
jgi:hypothetical protein